MSSDIRQHKDPAAFIDQTLSDIGLSDKERFVYLDLVQNGPRPVAVLAKRAGLSRTNGYDVVKSLEEKGLCYGSGTSYGKSIHANDPTTLHELVAKKRVQLDRIEGNLEKLASVIQVKKVQPYQDHDVAYYSGAENIKKLFMLMSSSGIDHIYGVGSDLDLESVIGYDTLEAFNVRRKENNIRYSVLRAGPRRLSGEVFTDDKKYLREIRIRPKGKVRLKSQMYLYDNRIVFLNLFDKPFATVIHNEPMYVMFLTWFDFIWQASKTLK